MPEMTPLEAAEILECLGENLPKYVNPLMTVVIAGASQKTSVLTAASYLRKIASGEYAPVVHGRWVEVDDGVMIGNGTHLECSNCRVWSIHRYSYCRCCGAVMDGKDDTHE